ncbi:4-(cytidine 5'-diphospho)-2-C-methyl-D-erythritol kinase [Candidatus Bipolaricaulota bacterium]|nr:4-(cytidine 5'-diphospho)-2-C-methyl-D-erythritol kinase [Candidatus Bipolaricaulota bacterium]
MTVHVAAYAKLNLFLTVCGERQDGFHEIHSLVQTIHLADYLAVSLAPDLRVSCSVDLGGINIVETAVRRLLREKGTSTCVHIWIDKRIPIGAGLGGGSSDAAAALGVVNRMIPPLVSQSRLAEIAGSIGADVPLFLSGGCIELEGLGHPIRRLTVRDETFVVLVPDVQCLTRDVYEAWQIGETSACREKLGHNDLLAAAIRLHPELACVSQRMSQLNGLYSGMTGSGSAFFTAFATALEAERACERLAGQQLGGRVYYCQPTKLGFVEIPDTELSEPDDSEWRR